MKIAIFQSVIPHYREYLFKSFEEKHELDIFLYGKKEDGLKSINISNVKLLNFFSFGRFNFFLPPTLNKYDIIILQGNMWHLTNWLLLILNKFHHPKILLFGHGIGCKNYLNEIHKPLIYRRLFHKLSDGILFYTNDVAESFDWKVPYISINNTLSLVKLNSKKIKKNKNKITFLVLTRFNSITKRCDLLNDFILKLPENKYDFNIVGDGEFLSRLNLKNVTYYGAVYNETIIDSLFAKSDCFVHLAWTGLSIVQALAKGLCVVSLTRSIHVHHSVEFEYLNKDFSIIEDNINLLVDRILKTTYEDYIDMGLKARKYYESNLLPETQIDKLDKFLEKIIKN